MGLIAFGWWLVGLACVLGCCLFADSVVACVVRVICLVVLLWWLFVLLFALCSSLLVDNCLFRFGSGCAACLT